MTELSYTLRNQDKIAESLGDNYLNLLLLSLDYHFKIKRIIDEIRQTNTNHTFIFVPSQAKNSEIEFQFVLLRKDNNVYKLAYYSSIG